MEHPRSLTGPLQVSGDVLRPPLHAAQPGLDGAEVKLMSLQILLQRVLQLLDRGPKTLEGDEAENQDLQPPKNLHRPH